MNFLEISTFVVYFIILITIVIFSYHKQKSDTDFVIGNRSLNYWLTALSAQASDMSNWLFMGYPMMIFTVGVFNIWAAIGLIVFMYLNWQFIAPKVRSATEKMNNLTLNAYFESRLQDKSGSIRLVSAIISFAFFSIYISAGLVGMGFLVESLFGLHYIVGITIPNYSFKTLLEILLMATGWGIGYFGQPHIITKFMGIKNVEEMPKAKLVGLSWQILALGGASILGLLGIYLFPQGLNNPQLVVVEIVKANLAPIFSGLVLCAILAATINVMAAQILVVASSISEDFCKGFFFKNATHKQLLKISRLSVILVGLIAYIIAYFKISTIYNLVLYAWSGIGASFGPLLLISLYYKKVNKTAGLLGIISGGAASAIWPIFEKSLSIDIPPLVMGFAISSLIIFLVSHLKKDIYAK
ncbi:MAG: sodium/proline symporter [Chlamydiae bacterium]|nr:sodium/proline symporter [Chlamydiota bacterium]